MRVCVPLAWSHLHRVQESKQSLDVEFKDPRVNDAWSRSIGAADGSVDTQWIETCVSRVTYSKKKALLLVS